MVKQQNEGYRFSIEPFFLADFANVFPNNKVIDVGTGVGIIPILLCKKNIGLKIIAIEIQKSLSDIAIENIESEGLSANIDLINGDFLKVLKKLKIESLDLIISNPPYRKLNSGRVSLNQVKAFARHEIKLNLPNLVKACFELLKVNGKIILSYPISRKSEVLTVLNCLKMTPRRVLNVCGRPGAIAKFFLVEAEKLGIDPSIEEDSIYIYKPDGSYSEKMEQVYASFDYPSRSHGLWKEFDSTGVSQ